MKFEEIILNIKNNTPELIDVPELNALKGRIQPPQHHPEGDAYTHTMLVIRRAREISTALEVAFGGLVHDFGKAVTDNDNLPHHYNHEVLGVSMVQDFCKRIEAPEPYSRVAVAATREHLNIHRFFQLRSIKKLSLLQRLSFLTRDELQCIVLIAQADAQGRGPLFVNKPYPQAKAVLKAYDIVSSVQQKMIRVYQSFERECLRLFDEAFPRQTGEY